MLSGHCLMNMHFLSNRWAGGRLRPLLKKGAMQKMVFHAAHRVVSPLIIMHAVQHSLLYSLVIAVLR